MKDQIKLLCVSIVNLKIWPWYNGTVLGGVGFRAVTREVMWLEAD